MEMLTFAASIVSLSALLLLVATERRRGTRFFLSAFRGWLDGSISAVEDAVLSVWKHFVKYVVQLNWYYSIHSVIRAIMVVLVRFYDYFERHLEYNRARAKRLRAERRKQTPQTHLEQVAAHKAETALTPAEQKKLRQKKLEERH